MVSICGEETGRTEMKDQSRADMFPEVEGSCQLHDSGKANESP